ncbi:MAG: DNA-directed RNA polymerase subunit alpha C-terminal domain-containing protein [Fimbriiglobus sp.]
MTDPLIDLRALLVEREEFEGSMVSKLREGLAQGGAQVKALKDINETLTKRIASAAPPQQKKLHLKLGVVHFYLGHMNEAVDHLKQSDGPLAAFFKGRALTQRGEYEEALKSFDVAEKSGYAAQQVQLQRAGVLRLQKHIGEAKAILVKLKDMAAHNAEYHYQEGGIAEAEGDIPRSAKSYERASELDPAHTGALFRLGFLNDLVGNDLEAIGYYEKCLKHPPVGKGVLYNLGVLYEDNGQFDKAADCYRRLHKADPNDERARLFLKDSEQSLNMYYSPDDEKVSAQFRQVMEVPISDFELSVRSRNCLKRMNIRTLGDLTRISEQQLLTSKNFGETSLDEIKIIMNQKGLRIGQSLEQGQQYEFRGRQQSHLSPEEQAMMAKPVSELNLSVRARKCMNRLNIATLGELTSRTSDELMEAKNFGVTSLTEVKEKLTAMGLKLRGE